MLLAAFALANGVSPSTVDPSVLTPVNSYSTATASVSTTENVPDQSQAIPRGTTTVTVPSSNTDNTNQAPQGPTRPVEGQTQEGASQVEKEPEVVIVQSVPDMPPITPPPAPKPQGVAPQQVGPEEK